MFDPSDSLMWIGEQFVQSSHDYAFLLFSSGEWGLLQESQLYRQWIQTHCSPDITAADLAWERVPPIQLEAYCNREDLLLWMSQHGIPSCPVVDANGQVLGAIRREQLQQVSWQVAQQQAQTCRQLLDNSPDVIERFDLNLRHLYVSGELYRLSGIPAKQMMGKTCREVGMSEAMVATWESAAQAVIATGQRRTIEFETETLKGIRTFEMTISPEWNEAGGLESLLCLSRDISERKQVEEALKHSEMRFQNLVSNIPGAVFQYVLHLA
ncbi:MAG: PAS domain-containing protein [Thermostichus sp. DG02_5_bins_236]